MNRFLKGAMILTLAGIIVKVIGAFSKVLIARVLGGEGIGLYMMAYPIYQIIVSISAAGIPVAISIMIAEKLANDDMRGVQQVFSVSLRVLTILGLVFSLTYMAAHSALRYSDYYRSTSSHSHSAVIASYLCGNDSELF